MAWTFDAACLGRDFLFAKNSAVVAGSPLPLGGGSKPSAMPNALCRRTPAGPQSTHLCFKLGALALALAGVGVLTGAVLVVRLIALPSGKSSSVLAAPNARLGDPI